ncbi:dithiol-disulfide isomerase [Elizabethkingia meningoseptica]|uniref:DsbA family protein n=1 Tax=Elizabethkingia meningoseptica TaxID=238 RepID=UPI00099AB178|nr:DsbA family protein [Elizabethkingia meningoseptica]OPC22074.1 dithiol-disulfide isomerase [Elizabethkingia meningoseptica]
MTENKNNPLLCDPETGVCEIPEIKINSDYKVVSNQEKPLKLVYFTDPICSSCWGIEPQLRKLKLEYGNILDIEYHMGGLLPDWSYNSGGISKPSDVAHHWDEVSVYYDMPIDGDIWLEDPLDSSYPPSIAFKAAEEQDKDKAVAFLRILREMVFLKKKNIAKWENIAIAAGKSGLDVVQLKTDFNGIAKKLFEDDLKMARDFGVRGFPTIFIQNKSGNKEMIYGTKPYSLFESTILMLEPNAVKNKYEKKQETLFSKYNSLTTREFSELSGISRNESEKQLDELTDKGVLEKLTIKNGSLWSRKTFDKM